MSVLHKKSLIAQRQREKERERCSDLFNSIRGKIARMCIKYRAVIKVSSCLVINYFNNLIILRYIDKVKAYLVA